MIRWIVGSSVRFRLLLIGAAAAALLIGATQLRNARVDILPEFTQPYVEIQTEALGLSAEEVEQLITVPLEADLLNGVAFLDEIHSESIAGLSSIVMTFEPGTDIFRARQVVAERLTQAHALPNVSKPPSRCCSRCRPTSRVMMVEPALERAAADRYVRSRPLDDPAAPDGRAGGRERVDLGRARSPDPGPGRSRAARCASRDAAARHRDRPATRYGFRR